MGSKLFTCALKDIYTSIYKATTIPLVCTSLIIGTSLLPEFIQNVHATQEYAEKSSLTVLQNINSSLAQQYPNIPILSPNMTDIRALYIPFSIYTTYSTTTIDSSINIFSQYSLGKDSTSFIPAPFKKEIDTYNSSHDNFFVLAQDYIPDPTLYTLTQKKDFSKNTSLFIKDIFSFATTTNFPHSKNIYSKNTTGKGLALFSDTQSPKVASSRKTINSADLITVSDWQDNSLASTYATTKAVSSRDTINIHSATPIADYNTKKFDEKTLKEKEAFPNSKPSLPSSRLSIAPRGWITIGAYQDVSIGPHSSIDLERNATVRLSEGTYRNFTTRNDSTHNAIILSNTNGHYIFSYHFIIGGMQFYANANKIEFTSEGWTKDKFSLDFVGYVPVDLYLSGKDTVEIAGGISTTIQSDTLYLNRVFIGRRLELNRGDDRATLHNDNRIVDSLKGGDGDDIINITGKRNFVGGFALGNGDDSVHLYNNSELSLGLLDFEAGTSILNIGNGAKLSATTISFAEGNDQLNVLGELNANAITMGDGNDTITFASSGRFTGNSIDLGAGDDYLTLTNSISTGFSPGTGNDTVNIPTLNTAFNATNRIPIASGSSLTFSGRGSFSFVEINNLGTLLIHLTEPTSRVSGSITGSGNANITMENGATFNATNINFGSLADTLVLLNGGSFIGNANLGNGDNSIRLHSGSLAGSLTTGNGADFISLTNSTMNGGITISGGNNSIELRDRSTLNSISIANGQNTIRLDNSTVTGDISAIGSNNQILRISNRSNVRGNIRLGSGHNLYVVEGNSTIIGGFTLAGGNDTILFQDTISITGDVHAGGGSNSLSLLNRSTISGSLSSGDNNDIASLRGASRVLNNVSLGNGRNTFSLLEGSFIGGTFSSGTGDDSIIIDGRSTVSGSINLGNGDNSIQIFGQSSVGLLNVGSGSDRVTLDNKSAITTDLSLGDGNNRLDVKGESSITGNITANNGNDSILINDVSEIGGNVSLGHGNNTFSLDNQSSIAGTLVVGNGDDSIIIANQSALTTNLELHEGNNILTVSKQSNIVGGITALAGADTIHVTENSSIQQDVHLGSGNNNVHLTQGSIGGSLTATNNNDSVVLNTFSIISGNVDLGHGVNLATIEGNSRIDGNLLTGLGNDSIILTNNSNITGDIIAGQGDNSIDIITTSRVNGKIETGNGSDTITISKQSTVSGGIFAFNGNNKITIEDNSSIDALTIGSGHDTILINNRASSTREIVLGEGNNSLSVQQNSFIDGFVSGGAGADTLSLSSNSHIAGNITLGNGLNTIQISDNARVGGEIRTGIHTDIINIANSEIQGNIVTGNGNDSLTIDNVRITGGVRTITVGENNSRDKAIITLSNAVHFDTPGGMISLLEGTYLLTLNNVNFGNRTGITMTGRGNNTLEAHGLLKNVGDILMGDGSAFVNFRDVTSTAGDIGTIVGGLLQDSILLHNSNFFGNIDFRTSGAVADTLRLSGGTLLSTATGITANGQIKIYTHDTSRIVGLVTLKDASAIAMEGTSVLQQSFTTATNNLVTLRMGDKSSIMGDIITSPTLNSRLTIDLYDESLVNSNIIMGDGNDSLRISFNNTARLTGDISTGAGNDSLYITGSSLSPTLPNAMNTGDGNDFVELSRLHLTGTFDMGDGSNTLSIIGDTTLAGSTSLNTSATDLVQLLNKSTLISTISVNGGSGTFILTPGTLLEGNISVQGQNMILNLDNQSILDGTASGGAGANSVTLKRAHITGSVLNPLAGTLTVDSRNSSIFGDIISAGRSTFEIIDSDLDGVLTVSNGGSQFNALRSTFLRSIDLTGDSNVNMSSSTVTEAFSASGGESFFTFNDMTFLRGVSLERGNSNTAIFSSSIEGNLVFNFNKNVTLYTDNNTTVLGNIILSNPDKTATNNFTLQNTEVHGVFSAGRNSGDGSYTFNNVRIGGEVELSRGQSIIDFNISTFTSRVSLYDTEGTISSSTIGGDIVFKGSSLLTIRNSEIFGELDFTNFMLKEQNITLDNSKFTGDLNLGNVENSITFLSTNVLGNVSGNINNDRITFFNSIISGNIDLAIGTDDNITFQGTNILLGRIKSNSVDIMGELHLNSATNTKLNVMLQTPTNSPGIILHEGGSIILNEGIVGDVLTFKGKLTINSTSDKMFFLDTNFYTGETDRINFDILTDITGNAFGIVVKSHVVATGQSDPLNTISGVITTNGVPMQAPQLAGKYASIGGSIYSLLENETIAGQWDLVLTGKNPVAHAYSAMIVSRRNYERVLWSKVSQNAFISALEATQNQYIYSDITKREFADHISTWADVQYSNNATATEQSISMVENLTAFSGGFNLERLELTPRDLISIGAFGMYGNSPITFEHTSMLGEYFNFGGELTGITAGLTAMWENIRGNAKRRLYISAGFWGTLYEHIVKNPFGYNDDNWKTYALSSVVNAGYRIHIKRFTIVPQIEVLHTFTKGLSMVSTDNTFVKFADEHRLTTRLLTLFAYNFDFGLQPFLKLTTEFPVLNTTSDNATSIAGDIYNYASQGNLYSAAFGVNYNLELKGILIKTFVDTSVHFGREKGIDASLGLSVRF